MVGVTVIRGDGEVRRRGWGLKGLGRFGGTGRKSGKREYEARVVGGCRVGEGREGAGANETQEVWKDEGGEGRLVREAFSVQGEASNYLTETSEKKILLKSF